MSRSKPLLDAALTYARRGWPVLPLHEPGDRGRCSCGRTDCQSPGKHPRTAHGLRDATTDEERIRTWWDRRPDANVGIATGTVSGLVAIDLDGDTGLNAWRALEAKHGDVRPTMTARTGRGYHLFFRRPVEAVKSCAALGGRVGVDCRGDGGYIVAPPSLHASGASYLWEAGPDEIELQPMPAWLLPLINGLAGGGTHDQRAETGSEPILEGARNTMLTSFAGSMRQRGMTAPAIVAALVAENCARCRPPLPDSEVRAIAASVARYPAAHSSSPRDTENRTVESWPEPPAPAVYHGILGEIVCAIEPHSEADPIALMAQSLVAFGSCIGGAPYFPVESSKHRVNEFLVMVGPTAGGRKGSAWDRARGPFASVDPEWERERVMGGLSSGEGLIDAVRDPIEEQQPVKEKGRVVTYQTIVTDPGVVDKRLLVFEAEFSRVLQVAKREGSTLSTTIRSAWDGPVLRVMTRSSRLRATGAHISVVAHITQDELLRQLEDTDAASGLGNRFMWIVVRRSKFLPEGGNIAEVDFAPLLKRLSEATSSARHVGELRRDPEARKLWKHEYERLSTGRPGLLGAMLGRAEAHVVRLSMLYALADNCREIQRPHLESALALWDYAERSCRFIFGDKLGDPAADELLRALRVATNGMTRTEIRDHFGRHKSANEIARALGVLARQGLAHSVVEQTEGRPVERWHAVTPERP